MSSYENHPSQGGWQAFRQIAAAANEHRFIRVLEGLDSEESEVIGSILMAIGATTTHAAAVQIAAFYSGVLSWHRHTEHGVCFMCQVDHAGELSGEQS